MKIAVNTRFLIKNRLEGIGRFTNEIFKRLTQNHKDITFYFLFDRPYSNEFIYSNNIIPVVLHPPARHPVLWYIWFQISVKCFVQRMKPDIFISPDGFIPLHTGIKTLSVIHDLNFEHRSQDIPLITRTYYRYFFPRFAKGADRIVTVSKFSKNDIESTYNINRTKIDVIYNGVSDGFTPVSGDEKYRIRHQYAEGQPYFVYLGAIHPRKNIINLLLSFDEFRKSSNQVLKLLIIGKNMFSSKGLKKIHSNLKHKNDIVFTGWLPDEELKKVIASALALTFVPYFEGFGIPVIEAMKCGVPVIASNVSSLPEVIRNSGLMVSPDSCQEISSAMLRMSDNASLRNRLIDDGLERSKDFTWEKAADEMWNTINITLRKNEQ